MNKKKLAILLISLLLFSCNTDSSPSQISKETTFIFSFSGDEKCDRVLIGDEEALLSESGSVTIEGATGDPLLFLFFKDERVFALLEVSSYTTGSENSYEIDTSQFQMNIIDAYEAGGTVYISWEEVMYADEYEITYEGNEYFTSATEFEIAGSAGNSISVTPVFNSHLGLSSTTEIREGRNDIEIIVKPLPDELGIEITAEDALLEYGGKITFSTNVSKDEYTITWMLNGKIIGHEESVDIYYDEEALFLTGEEESLMLILVKDTNIYSKTLTFVIN